MGIVNVTPDSFSDGGSFLDVDAAITSSYAYAQSLGVQCFFERPVQGWEATAKEVKVHLQNETVTASSLIITAGAWAGNEGAVRAASASPNSRSMRSLVAPVASRLAEAARLARRAATVGSDRCGPPDPRTNGA